MSSIKGVWTEDNDKNGNELLMTNYFDGKDEVGFISGLFTGGVLNFTEYFMGSYIMLTNRYQTLLPLHHMLHRATTSSLHHAY